MKYFDYYQTNSPIVKAWFGTKMPELDANDSNSVKAWQDWAVKRGYMTQDQVDTGYGKYGPKTKAAFEKAKQDNSSGGGLNKSSWDAYRPMSVVNTMITSSPGLTAIVEGTKGLYHKILNAIVDPEKHEALNRALSLPVNHRNNTSLTPTQREIYQSLGNYAIKHGAKSIDTGLINRWYKDVGQYEKAWNIFFNEDDKANWRYSNNKIGLLKKQFNPIERVMNTVGRASIVEEDGKHYITDLYDHNKSTYISEEYANNEKATNKPYGHIVLGLQNVHLSDEDPDWQKQSTRIEIKP